MYYSQLKTLNTVLINTTDFVPNEVNSTKTIEKLTSINGISIDELEAKMRPGGISRHGFLGPETLGRFFLDTFIRGANQEPDDYDLLLVINGKSCEESFKNLWIWQYSSSSHPTCGLFRSYLSTYLYELEKQEDSVTNKIAKSKTFEELEKLIDPFVDELFFKLEKWDNGKGEKWKNCMLIKHPEPKLKRSLHDIGYKEFLTREEINKLDPYTRQKNTFNLNKVFQKAQKAVFLYREFSLSSKKNELAQCFKKALLVSAKKLSHNFVPDTLLETLRRDNETVLKSGLTHQLIGNLLSDFCKNANSTIMPEDEKFVKITYQNQVYLVLDDGFAGYQESPFNDNLRSDSNYYILKLDDEEKVIGSLVVPGLVIDLIKKYGFYEGIGTSFRVDPKKVIEFLKLLPQYQFKSKEQKNLNEIISDGTRYSGEVKVSTRYGCNCILM